MLNWQWLSKVINKLMFKWCKLHNQCTFSNSFTDEVIINFHMFRMSMKNRVSGNKGSANIRNAKERFGLSV